MSMGTLQDAFAHRAELALSTQLRNREHSTVLLRKGGFQKGQPGGEMAQGLLCLAQVTQVTQVTST